MSNGDMTIGDKAESRFNRFLNHVEKICNQLPDPFSSLPTYLSLF